MKTCPFCAESVQDPAVKCRHCGSRLEGPPAAADRHPGPVDPPEATPDGDVWRIDQVTAALTRAVQDAATWLVGQHRAEVAALTAHHEAALAGLQRALVGARQQAEAAESQRLHGEAEWQVASDDWAAQYEQAVAALAERDAEIARLGAEPEQRARPPGPDEDPEALRFELDAAAHREVLLGRELAAANDRARSLARRVADLEQALHDELPPVTPPSSFDRSAARRLPEPAPGSFDRSPARRLPEPAPPPPERPPEFAPIGDEEDRIPDEMSEALKSHPRIVLPPPSRPLPPARRR